MINLQKALKGQLDRAALLGEVVGKTILEDEK